MASPAACARHLGVLLVSGATALAACSSAEDPVAALVRNRGTEVTDAGAKAASDAGPAPSASTPAPPPAPTTSSTAKPDAGPPPLVETYVSDLAYEQITNGYGDVEKDRSNGEMANDDGNTITLAGTTYTKGLGVHAASEVRLALGAQYKTFRADVGVDDEVGDNGSVVFQVLLDGVVAFDSGTMTGASPTKKVDLDVSGKQELRLVVTDANDGGAYDHADWASARVGK